MTRRSTSGRPGGAEVRRKVLGEAYVDRTRQGDALLQMGGYAGFPAAVEALRVLSEIAAPVP
jgi:hypothetical protein